MKGKDVSIPRKRSQSVSCGFCGGQLSRGRPRERGERPLDGRGKIYFSKKRAARERGTVVFHVNKRKNVPRSYPSDRKEKGSLIVGESGENNAE